MVFPTRVGVDLSVPGTRAAPDRFPHTRGGGPVSRTPGHSLVEFSPHAWGWTYILWIRFWKPQVFPTRVGVDRQFPQSHLNQFVFPTRVGVDLLLRHFLRLRLCFPHTRGGGPAALPYRDYGIAFSPHAWGWTAPTENKAIKELVFPTRVGVDLSDCLHLSSIPRFPHTRGGGPAATQPITLSPMFSPHAWGWTA